LEILFFVEDPGAANFIEDLPSEITQLGINTRLLAINYATKHLMARKINFDEIDSKTCAKNVISKYNPKLLVVGTSQNPKSLGLELIDYGKAQGIPTVGFIDSAADSELRFCGVTNLPLNHAPDWIIVPDKYSRKLFINFGYSDQNIIVTGSPNYERISRLRQRLEKVGVDVLREKHFQNSGQYPIVIFIDEHSNAGDQRLFKSRDYTFSGRPGAKNRNEIIAGEILDALIDLEITPYFVVRLHPKSNETDYKSLSSEINKFSWTGDPYELIFCADLIVGITSMLLMESVLLGKEVISAIPREEEKEWAPPGLLDNIGCITTSDDLRKKLDSIFLIERKSNFQKKLIEDRSVENIVNFLLERLKADV